MGYMLPINHYQYEEYRKRITKDRQKPFYVNKPYKIVLGMQYRDISERGAKLPHNQTRLHKPKTEEKPALKKAYADITGKGRHFAERI